MNFFYLVIGGRLNSTERIIHKYLHLIPILLYENNYYSVYIRMLTSGVAVWCKINKKGK